MTEDMILNQIDVENELKKLNPADREMLLLMFKLYKPDDWTGRWPPKLAQIGDYIGRKFEGKPLTEAAIRYRKKAALEQLRGTRPPLRRRAE